MQTSYGYYLIPFLIVGVIFILFDKRINNSLTISFLSIIIVLYAFFSIIVATKMPAFTYPVSSLIIILISFGILKVIMHLLFHINKHIHFNIEKYILIGLFLSISICSLKPWNIIEHRNASNKLRNSKVYNTKIYKSLDETLLKNHIIFNCKSFEDVELMFYKDLNAYHWYPEKKIVDSLLNLGYKLAAFKSHNDQILPDYISKNKNITILHEQLK